MVFRLIFLLVLLVFPSALSADIANFDIAGRIYTKWLYRNNDSQGVLSYGNPFWPDDIAGDNGASSEFELKIFGKVSDKVEAYVRLQSRFGALWQDWWESGERKYGGKENTSGDSLGMNRAEYIKLRGIYVKAKVPLPTVDWITVGSSDLNMFNPWTIGKVRFIDRDNAKGVFVDGHAGDFFSYNLAFISLPKLWVGPWWSTGIGDPALANPFYSQDWAYGANLKLSHEIGRLSLIAAATNDIEIDVTDPDAVGSLYPECKDALGNPIGGCEKDHAVDYFSRFLTVNTTIEAELDITDRILVNFLGGYSEAWLDPQLTANGVEENDGVFPVVYGDTYDFAARFRLELSDPFGMGLSFKAEYFYIGEEWNSIFGARREADVLLTDGFIEGGQLPTLNLANEFLDFDEQFVESCIGWHGATLITSLLLGAFETDAEFTFITYDTNAQNRDVLKKYPDFLHTDGYTDVDLYDYANITDRGRDPRSVYKENQDRKSFIAVLKNRYLLDVGGGLELSSKLKFIYDEDFRSLEGDDDDYTGKILTWKGKIGYYLADGLLVEIGGQIDRWWEENRKGTKEQGYGDDKTSKEKVYAGLTYDFEGIKFKYHFEYIHKYQDREREENQLWNVFRSKASLEVAW